MLQGYWYQEGSAERRAATLSLDENHFTIQTLAGESVSGDKLGLKVSDRLGNVERKISLEDGSIFTTSDNDRVDQLFKQETVFSRFIHSVESHLGWAVIALIITVSSGYAFFTWGVPWTGKQIAHILPHKTNVIIAEQSFEFLDDYLLEPSHLNEERQEQLKDHFDNYLVQALSSEQGEIEYTLHFRQWNQGETEIPNALALPSGDIILTDKFVGLATNQQEIDSVLLHEMGHIVHRHSLQMLVETTMVTTAIMMVTGDTSSVADMGIGLGSLLVSSHYSRGHETEADLFAFQKMLKLKIDPQAFSDIMARMTSYSTADEKGEEPEADAKHSDSVELDDENSDWLDYLSTHPSTEKRIAQAQQFRDCFQQGLDHCELVEPQP